MSNNIDSIRDFLKNFPSNLEDISKDAHELTFIKGCNFFISFLQSPGINNLMNQTMPSTVNNVEEDKSSYLLALNSRELLIPSLTYYLEQLQNETGAYERFEERLTNLIDKNNDLVNKINHQIDIKQTLEGTRKILAMAIKRPENFQDFGYKESEIYDLLNLLEVILQKVNAWR